MVSEEQFESLRRGDSYVGSVFSKAAAPRTRIVETT